MKLIVGLGNIGKDYEKTYHNMGFLTIDKFAEKNGFAFTKEKCNALVAEGRIDNEKVVLAKPTTYMNNSGLAINELMRKNGCELKDLLVIVDDIDLPCGATRFRKKGSSGTHNGMRSCVEHLQSEEFARLRMGVGKPDVPLIDFVLKKIDNEHWTLLSSAIENEAQDMIMKFIKNQI